MRRNWNETTIKRTSVALVVRASGTMKEQEIKSIKAFTSVDRKD
jgi:hypothetical protein